jgi:hypothetical protein
MSQSTKPSFSTYINAFIDTIFLYVVGPFAINREATLLSIRFVEYLDFYNGWLQMFWNMIKDYYGRIKLERYFIIKASNIINLFYLVRKHIVIKP